MNKVIKILFCAVALVSTFALCALSVSAESIGVNINPYYYNLDKFQLNTSDGWEDVPEGNYSFSYVSMAAEQAHGSGRLYASTGGAGFSGWRAAFSPLSTAGNLTVDPGLYLSATIGYIHNTSYVQDLTGAMYVTTSAGIIYEFPLVNAVELVYPDGSLRGYLLNYGGQVTVGTGFDTKDCTIEFVASGVNTAFTLQIDFNQLTFTTLDSPLSASTAKVVESIDQATQDIINNADENAAEIIGAVDDGVDQITDGWSTDDNTSGEVDDFTSGMGDAESDALGGKSDEEIQAEVDAALSGDGLPAADGAGVIAVGRTFDDLLNVFGDKYQSLLVLSLTLGLAALLAGRSYRAKGD